MADSYVYDADGKLHTRWSELKRCTEGGVEAVVMEKLGIKHKYSGDTMEFGRERHLMWEEESKNTGLIPEDFWPRLPFVGIPTPQDAPLSHVETPLAYELFPNIIIHFTADSISQAAATVFDNKTIIGSAQQFRNSDQLLVYAFLAGKLGITVKRGVWLCELWSQDRKRIIGYDNFEKKFGLIDFVACQKTLEKRCETLYVATEVIRERIDKIGTPRITLDESDLSTDE